jgi:hypothetical protein
MLGGIQVIFRPGAAAGQKKLTTFQQIRLTALSPLALEIFPGGNYCLLKDINFHSFYNVRP